MNWKISLLKCYFIKIYSNDDDSKSLIWLPIRLLATCSADTTVRIWRTSGFSLLTELKEQTQRWVWDCAFSGDSQYLITGKNDITPHLRFFKY